MADLYLTNSLTGKKEKFEAINPPDVGIYTCGPTVYDYPTIGNWRTYTLSDVLLRVLKYLGYKPIFYMNLTDVGHFTGDNLGDADIGEDRMEKAAKKQGKSAWDIAEFYIKDFLESYEKLNLTRPEKFTRATEYIKEQIELVEKIHSKGYAYKIDDGIYFDVQAYETAGNVYGELSTLQKIKEGARVEPNLQKKNPRDFALWKFSSKDSKRQMEWESPWGMGFPGWHIECSAMSRKYLGDTFDIHTGGVDHIPIHHTNEIAQSEGAMGKMPAKFWIHHEFLQIDGGKMAKSLGNTYTLEDVIQKGFDPLALRYLFLTAHYKDPLNFTWENLGAVQTSLEKLRSQVSSLKEQEKRIALSEEKNEKIEGYREDFVSALSDDLNTAKALAVFWEMLKSNIPSTDKYDLAISFDEVLGLKLGELQVKKVKLPEKVQKLIQEREKLRGEGKFDEADEVRKEIAEEGFILEDTPQGPKVKPQ